MLHLGFIARHVAAVAIVFLFGSGACAPITQERKTGKFYDPVEQFHELFQEGNYAEAIPVARRALIIQEQTLGPVHPDVAQWYIRLAFSYDMTGDDARAEPLYKRALVIQEKTLGIEHPDVATTLSFLSAFYFEAGDYERAAPLLERELAIREKTLAPEHPDLAQTFNNLAEVYRTMGDYARAEPLYERALAIREKSLGHEHPDVATTLNDLAMLYESTGDLARAEPLLHRALIIYEQAFGPEHPEVGATFNYLGLLYYQTGDYRRAEIHLERALAIRLDAPGPDRSDVAQSLNNLALVYKTSGNYERAESMYKQVLAFYEKVLGHEHLDLAIALNNLASLYYVMGDYVQAEPLLQRALTIREKALRAEHPYVAQSLNNLAELYRTTGDYTRAQYFFERALVIYKKVFGPNHPVVALVLSNLGVVCQNTGQYVRAALLLNSSIAIYEKALESDHPDLALALNNLAMLHYTAGNYEGAKPLLERALAIEEKTLGREHSSVAGTIRNLALAHTATGDYATAEALLKRALAIDEKALGSEHPAVATTLDYFAELYWARGQPDKALAYLSRSAQIEEHNLQLFLATGLEERRRAYAALLRGSTHVIVSLNVRELPNNPEARRLALQTILRRKGRVLEATASTLAGVRDSLDKRDREIFDAWREARTRLATLTLRGPGDQSPEVFWAGLTALREQVNALERQLGARSARFRSEATAVRIAVVQNALPADAALVEFIAYQPFDPKAATRAEKWGAERYAAYVLLPKGEPRFVELGEAAPLHEKVTALRDSLARPAAWRVRETARALDAALFAPLVPLLGDVRQVFLSPDGQLHLVPFAALVDEKDHYRVEQYTFGYLTTGRDLIRLGQFPERRGPPLVMAAPDFDAVGAVDAVEVASSSSPAASRSRDFGGVHFAPLPGTQQEAAALAELLALPKSRVLTGTHANEASLKLVRGPTLLHVATHAFFLPDQPEDEISQVSNGGFEFGGERNLLPPLRSESALLRAGLVLAGVNKSPSAGEDGVLTAYEAAGLDLQGTELVVLSACETGIGDVANGEGVYGLRRALVLAGARSQLMSLWKVNDQATQKLMAAYYGELLAGVGRADALRAVQLEMLGSPALRHPYYWASFIPIGDWRPIEGLAKQAETKAELSE